MTSTAFDKRIGGLADLLDGWYDNRSGTKIPEPVLEASHEVANLLSDAGVEDTKTEGYSTRSRNTLVGPNLNQITGINFENDDLPAPFEIDLNWVDDDRVEILATILTPDFDDEVWQGRGPEVEAVTNELITRVLAIRAEAQK